MRALRLGDLVERRERPRRLRDLVAQSMKLSESSERKPFNRFTYNDAADLIGIDDPKQLLQS